MREENWYKMLVASAILHVFIIGAFSIPLRKAFRKPDLSYYSVNLVGDISGGAQVPKAAPAPAVKPAPKEPEKKPEPKKEKPVKKEQPVTTTKERSLAPIKKKNVPETTTKAEVKSLDKRIREMKSHVQYLDVSGKKDGPPLKGVPGVGSSGPVDPVLQKYYADVWEKIQESWHAPNLSSSKGLLTVVSVTIRKDGRITDWRIERRSGNMAYDESIARALRSIDTLPPIPPSLAMDSIDVGFNFHPPTGEGK